MNIEAHLNTLRISPRKVRVVVGMLPGLSVREAEHQLDRELRRAALPIRKLLLSAVSNAEHNFHAVPENLVVARVVVNEGKKLKRWMPRAQGRATGCARPEGGAQTATTCAAGARGAPRRARAARRDRTTGPWTTK